MLQNAEFDLDIHCILKTVFPNTKGKYGILKLEHKLLLHVLYFPCVERSPRTINHLNYATTNICENTQEIIQSRSTTFLIPQKKKWWETNNEKINVTYETIEKRRNATEKKLPWNGLLFSLTVHHLLFFGCDDLSLLSAFIALILFRQSMLQTPDTKPISG